MKSGEAKMVGVILAGGKGTRLRPLTYVANKHLLPVYDRPMIYYPIQVLQMMGCDEIIIVSGGEHIGGFADLLKDGSEYGVNITYKVQPSALGIADALGCVEGLVDGVFPVILGDNFFSEVPPMPDQPTIYLSETETPTRFGIYSMNSKRITEKPTVDMGNLAVTGLYIYDNQVFDMIKQLKPSERGEFEITDINNRYLELSCNVVEMKGFWSDMGTFDSLMEVATYVQANS